MKFININILGTIALSIIGFVFVGCSDSLLEKNPPDAISDANFWTGPSDAKLALVGCYRCENNWSMDDFLTPQGLMYLDLAGGNGTEKENFTTLMASSNTVATNSNLYRYWANAYTHIARYNNFLTHIEDCPMDETLKEQYKAEVKCLRAYYFFSLAFYFKDVPMPLAPLSKDEANTIAQTSQADVYSQVETDLISAISVLPDEYDDSNFGRFTSGAARTLLSRLYLAEERWQDAADILKEVMDSGIYQIDTSNGEDSYEKLFQIGGENSPEQIFCITYVKDKYTTTRYQYLYPECAYGGWHQFAVYNELVKSYFCSDGKTIDDSPIYDDDDPYANRDLRLYASVFLPPLGSYTGTTYNDITYDCFKGPNTSDSYNRYTLFDGYCPKKGCDPSITSNLTSTYTYTPIMRYAEVLLSYLEALNEYQPTSVSQQVLDQTINLIRNRAELPSLQITDLPTQDDVRQAVRAERRVELAFEGLRYFDVLRWNLAKELLNHTFTGVKLSDNPTDRNYRGSGSTASPVDEDGYYQFETRTWDDHNRYFPIPQSDLNVNKNLKQNEGYN
jgi:hypothetical protein